MSHLAFFEDRGIAYKSGGQPKDALISLKDSGLNCVRLRLFTSSAAQAQANPYNYTNNLDYTLPLAVRVKQAGLQFLLDFHYSDTWADPGKQTKPAAWTNLSFAQLEQRMYDYNSNTIAAFKTAGAMPDWVQIGNEITPGLLWPDGRVGGNYDTAAQWSNLGRLLRAAIRGVKDAAGTKQPMIMIHIDRGGDWNATQWYFDHIVQEQVEFDLLGQSFYPWWHGDFSALSNCLHNSVARYGKPVVVAETAFPWTNSPYNPKLDIASTPEGQVTYVASLASIVKGVAGGKGIGIFWWGTEYVRLSGFNLANFDKTSFFDYSGNTLPVAAAFGQLAAPVNLRAGLSNGAITLKWPLSGAAMTLTTATNPVTSSNWAPVTNDVTSSSTGFSTNLPKDTNNPRFYRLQSK